MNILRNPKYIDEELKPYFAPDGEEGPYASPMTDLVFKKIFNPESPEGHKNLRNFLNDLLAPQLAAPIKRLWIRNPELNRSGSNETRSSSFDLHCEDAMGRHFEIEVQIRFMGNFLNHIIFYASQILADQGQPGKKWDYELNPIYMLSFSDFNIFKDKQTVHRCGLIDQETGKVLSNLLNFTFVELPKIAATLDKNDPEEKKWIFIMRYLNRLSKLPPLFEENKFEHLLHQAKISNFNYKEYQRYEKEMHLEWDDYAIFEGFKQTHPEYFDKIRSETEIRKAQKTAISLLNQGINIQVIAKATELSEREILELKEKLEHSGN